MIWLLVFGVVMAFAGVFIAIGVWDAKERRDARKMRPRPARQGRPVGRRAVFRGE